MTTLPEYLEARAWAEDRAAELEHHAKRHPADHGAKRDAKRFRTLLAGPPVSREDEPVAWIGESDGGVQAVTIHAAAADDWRRYGRTITPLYRGETK
jgi:hypothetical protein